MKGYISSMKIMIQVSKAVHSRPCLLPGGCTEDTQRHACHVAAGRGRCDELLRVREIGEKEKHNGLCTMQSAGTGTKMW